MKHWLAGLTGILVVLPVVAAQETKTVAPGTPVTITVSPATPAAPPVSITLKERHGHVTPNRTGFTHTGAGYIDVAQPSPDTVVVTMTGVAVAGGHPAKDSYASMNFDLNQNFEVSFDDPKVKKAKITIEGRVIGLLRSDRSHGCGGAEMSNANVAITSDATAILALAQVPHAVAGGDNLSINDHEGPVEGPIVAGKFTLHQCFAIAAHHSRSVLPCKPASAEFAPDPALDPLWISYWEPFHGAAKKDFGYQVTIKVADDSPK